MSNTSVLLTSDTIRNNFVTHTIEANGFSLSYRDNEVAVRSINNRKASRQHAE